MFLSAKKKLFAVENKEVILNIWSFHGNKNSPGYIACNLQVDGIIHRFYCFKIKITTGGKFFSKTTAKPRIFQFRTHNLAVLIIVLFPSVYGPCFW